MDFLECAPEIPRPETGQEEAKEEAIREIKRMVGLPLDNPKLANRPADKAVHITTSRDRHPKSSFANKARSGRITKPPFSKNATAKISSTKTAKSRLASGLPT
jgi:hypothetical protein